MKNILMIGGGVSGKAVAELSDALNVKCRIVNDTETADTELDLIFTDVDLVVVSPGVLPTSRLYNGAVERKIEVISELELGIRFFPGKMLAITGTNGKTTTVELTEFILNKLGVRAIAAGNIGLPLSAVAAQIVRGEFAEAEKLIAVLEVSSFQLEHTSGIPAEAAVLLNIESDHINRYPGGMAEYQAVKERIFAQVAAEKCFRGISMSNQNSCGAFAISDDALFFNGKKLVALAETALAAPHNQENLLAALNLCNAVADLEKQIPQLINALKDFKTGDHRISLVEIIDSVKYIDDSKATNPAAVLAAVKSLEKIPRGNIILIAGGLDKAMDFSPLSSIESYLKKVIIYGQCGKAVAEAFSGDMTIFDAEKDFARAVAEANKSAAPGDTVLLSPAAASMDMFKDYKERGNEFARLVRELKK